MRPLDLSLRARLFLGLGGLVVLLVAAQLWLVRTLSQELREEVDFVALEVGTSVANFFTFECRDGEEDCAEKVVHVTGDAAAGEEKIRRLEERVLSHMVSGDSARVKTIRRMEWSSRSEVEVGADPGGPGATGGEPSSEVDGVEVDGVEVDGAEVDGGEVEVVPEENDEAGGPKIWVWTSSRSGESDGVHGGSGDEVEGEIAHVGHEIRVQLTDDSDTPLLLLERPDFTGAVPIPRLGLRAKLERFQRGLLVGSGLLLVFGLVVAAYSAHRVSRPLSRLAVAAEEVGGGALGVQVEDAGGGREVRRTLSAFNAMSRRLAVLDERNRRLEALRHLEELGDVARGMAHSLRNPLNALGLSVEELAARGDGEGEADEGAEDDGRREQLALSARRQIQRLDAGIRSFLLLASPGDAAGTEPVAVDELVRDVVLEALQDAGGRVGIDLDADDVGAAAVLSGVVAELRSVVQALVVNAVEASPDGGRVRVGLERLEPPGEDPPAPAGGDSRSLRLEVADRGPGLAPEVRERLFTPHLSTKPNGSGMGLFLAHRIASHRYGGRLELLERDGGGTLARLELGARRGAGEDEVGS